MFALNVPLWGLFWGFFMATGLSLLVLPLVPCVAACFKTNGASFFVAPLLVLNWETPLLKCCLAGGLSGRPLPSPVFACPASFSSTSPLFSFLCPLLASSRRSNASFEARAGVRRFGIKNLNGLPPVTQLKSTLCLVSLF